MDDASPEREGAGVVFAFMASRKSFGEGGS
jgi:hypothetical protein